jgi:endonuclease/exonuclease/phosphatase family metal-dependent hydrolase
MAFFSLGCSGASAVVETDAFEADTRDVTVGADSEPAVDAHVPATAPVTVVTYNVRYDNPADGENGWVNRREAIVEYLTGVEPDIIGFQETTTAQRAYLAEHLSDYDWYGVGRDDNMDRGESSPIFYLRERFERVGQNTFWLSETPDVPGSVGWDAELPRVASWVRLRDRESGRELLMVNTHYDHRGTQARLESSRLIARTIDELATADGERLPVVLTGDFNAGPNSAPYYAIVEAEDASHRLLDAQHVSTEPHRGGDSTSSDFMSIRPGGKIDHIFVRDVAAVLSHRIDDPRVEDRFVSDHLPIVATILPDGAAP